MSGIHPYWQIPEHRTWKSHYGRTSHNDKGGVLAFTRAFRDQFLPKGMEETNHADDLLLEILDKKTGKTYPCQHVVSYETKIDVLDADWNSITADGLQDYFYGCHFCGCHVAHHIHHFTTPPTIVTGYHDIDLDADPDGHCPRGRFDVVKIVAKMLPDLILWSETMSAEELDDMLYKLPGAPAVDPV